MKILATIWDNTYGLLVDDGSMAAGALVAILVSGAVAYLAPTPALRNLAGYLLLALICALILINLYTAGRNAARKRVQSDSH